MIPYWDIIASDLYIEQILNETYRKLDHLDRSTTNRIELLGQKIRQKQTALAIKTLTNIKIK